MSVFKDQPMNDQRKTKAQLNHELLDLRYPATLMAASEIPANKDDIFKNITDSFGYGWANRFGRYDHLCK